MSCQPTVRSAQLQRAVHTCIAQTPMSVAAPSQPAAGSAALSCHLSRLHIRQRVAAAAGWSRAAHTPHRSWGKTLSAAAPSSAQAVWARSATLVVEPCAESTAEQTAEEAAEALLRSGGEPSGSGRSEFCVVNFYHLRDLRQPAAVIHRHREWLRGRDILGRIYISNQGINAQLSGPQKDAHAYADWVSQQPEFQVGLRLLLTPTVNVNSPTSSDS